MKTTFKTLAIAVLAITMSSCASLISGSTQTVKINSNVDAEIVQNGQKIGMTNTYMEVNRSDIDQVLMVKREGCVTKEYAMPEKWNPVMIMDYVLMGGFAGAGVALELSGIVGATSFGLVSVLPALTDVSQGANIKTEKEHTVNLECD